MIADDFDSIKKALEEILKEKEKEKVPKEPQPGYVYDVASDRFVPASTGGLKDSQALSGTGIWGNIVWSTKPADQQGSGQQAPAPTGQPSAVIRPGDLPWVLYTTWIIPYVSKASQQTTP